MLAGDGELEPVVPDDVTDPVPIGDDGPETEKPEAWVPAVTGAQDCVIQGLPPRVVEEGRGLR
jgi:hypothetical protein